MTDPTPPEPPVSEPEPEKPKSRVKNAVITAIKLGLAVGLLAYLFVSGGLTREILEKPLASPLTLVTVVAFGAIGISASGLRWWILLRAEGIHVPLLLTVRLTWIGHFWNLVIPGAVSGDAVKMFYVGRLVPKEQREESWSTVFADRVIGLLALISLSTLAALASLDLMWERTELRLTLLFMIALLSSAAIGGLVLATGIGRGWRATAWGRAKLPRGLGEGLARAYNTLRRLTRAPKAVALAYAISFGAHCLTVLNAYLLGRLLTDALEPLTYFALVPIGMFSNAIPLTPGGAGIGENVLGSLFTWAGAGGGLSEESLNAAGGAIMLWVRVVFYALGVVGGLLYVLYKRGDAARTHEEPPVPTGSRHPA